MPMVAGLGGSLSQFPRTPPGRRTATGPGVAGPGVAGPGVEPAPKLEEQLSSPSALATAGSLRLILRCNRAVAKEHTVGSRSGGRVIGRGSGDGGCKPCLATRLVQETVGRIGKRTGQRPAVLLRIGGGNLLGARRERSVDPNSAASLRVGETSGGAFHRGGL